MSRKVWFQLVDGDSNKIGTVASVRMPFDSADVADVRKVIFAEVSRLFPENVVPLSLVVFANRADHTSGQKLPRLSLPLGQLGIDEDNPIIIKVPSQRRAEINEEPAQKKLKQSTVILNEQMNAIAHNLDIKMWQIGGITLEICRVESDFPEWYYVRKETLDIIKVFEAEMEINRKILFVGTPGVGKSMMVVVFAFYMALIQKKRVFLLRKFKVKGFSMLHLDVEKKNCWRFEKARIEDIRLLRDYWKSAVLCLDGLLDEEVRSHYDILAPFRMLATSAQYDIKDDDLLLGRCLVPFWSLSDLIKISAHQKWRKQEIKERYFHSGGNLRQFTTPRVKADYLFSVRQFINFAVRKANFDVATLLSTQYAVGSDQQIDRLRMTGLKASAQSNLSVYQDLTQWICVITSEYALRQLGKIVKPSYYEELYSKGCMLGDEGLKGIAFENYVHTMARDGKKIELKIRPYDRQQVREHTYVALGLEAKSICNDGDTATECDAAMKRFASSDDDYWYPSFRYLKTIDCVAKLSMDAHFDTTGLIQITNSATHKIDSNVVNRYAKFFPNASCYIALVPDKQTGDNFRLDPANPPTKVPLMVAYIANWRV